MMNSSASRTRVFVAVLALGLIAGAIGFRAESGAPDSANSEAHDSKSSGTVVASGAFTGSANAITTPGISLISSGEKSATVHKVFVTKPTLSQLQTAWKQSTIRMKYLDACTKSGKCAGFDSSEAYTYDLSVRQATARELEDFAQIQKVWMSTNGGDMPAEGQLLARYFLSHGNDDVKDAAIRLIDLAKPSVLNMQTVAEALTHSSSGPLMKVFLKSELVKSCAERSYAAVCVGLVNRTIQRGGEGVQKTLARHSLLIMNPYTARSFARFEQSESPRSQKRKYLRLNREEYQRYQRGG